MEVSTNDLISSPAWTPPPTLNHPLPTFIPPAFTAQHMGQCRPALQHHLLYRCWRALCITFITPNASAAPTLLLRLKPIKPTDIGLVNKQLIYYFHTHTLFYITLPSRSSAWYTRFLPYFVLRATLWGSLGWDTVTGPRSPRQLRFWIRIWMWIFQVCPPLTPSTEPLHHPGCQRWYSAALPEQMSK